MEYMIGLCMPSNNNIVGVSVCVCVCVCQLQTLGFQQSARSCGLTEYNVR